jgi:porin
MTLHARWAIPMLLVGASAARADVPVDPCACSPNKPGFHRASKLTGDWAGTRSDLFEEGIEIQGTYAGEVFAAPGLDDGDNLVAAGLGLLAVDIDLATLARDGLGSFHIAGLAIHGDGLSASLMDVYGVSNNVATPDVRLFEAWIDQPLGPVGVRAGLLSADQEFIIANHGTVLIGATFGIVSILSYNVGNPVYPVATPGVSARVETDNVTARAAIYDGDQENDHGMPTGLGEHAVVLGEIELWSTLKLGAWHHTERGSGYYTVIDRQLAPRVGAFTRVSVAPDEPISTYVDAGVRIGPGPLRPRDFASVGIAWADTEMGMQTIAEATYQILVNGWLTIQPDVQLVLTPERAAGVIATRAVVAF